MAPTMLIQPPLTNPTTTNRHPHIPKPPPRVCFSFAAYAKTVIHHLTTQNVAVEPGLTAAEFASIESTLHFTFPPDLRSILQEGLPVGPGFPNWRSSSVQQLQILTNLPVLDLCRQVSVNNFWTHSWGEKPQKTDDAVALAKRFFKMSPSLVPIYRNCYIPSVPNLAGNPVFFVGGGDVRIWSFDVTGFFEQIDFGVKEGEVRRRTSLLNVPAWAATKARRIEFWTELVEGGVEDWANPKKRGGGRVLEAAAGGGMTRRRWNGYLVGCMEDVWCRLRNGGWKEEEVGEMIDGGDERDGEKGSLGCIRDLVEHATELSVILLRAGWSREDVVESLGCHVEINGDGYEVKSNWLKFHHSNGCLLMEAM